MNADGEFYHRGKIVYKTLIISFANLLYKIDLDDNDKRLLYKTFKGNKKMLSALNMKKKEFKIDVDQAHMERQGIDAVIHKPLELISEKWKYRNIGKEAVTNIRVQRNIQINDRTLDMRDRYNEDVRLIAKEGKIYYSTK